MSGPTTPIVAPSPPMIQPDLARLEGLLERAGDKSVSTRGIMDRKNAAHELANYAAYLPALLARVRELKKSLEPFAHYYESECGDTESDDTRIFGELRIGHFRRAALTLKENEDGQG